MCDSQNEWEEFWYSLTNRNGDDVFYRPRYTEWSDGETVQHFPWWSVITFFVARWHDRIYMIRKAFGRYSGWCKYEGNYPLNSFSRFGYTIKCVLCALFCYSRGPKDSNFYDYVNVATYDVHPSCGEYSGEHWTSLDVGAGAFRNWFISEYGDSSY